MKRLLEMRTNLSEMEVFSDHNASPYFPTDGARDAALSRWCKDGYIQRVKKGVYVFSGPLQKKSPRLFHLANYLYSPSYVSLQSMLSYYQLIPEAVYEVTSVTNKRPNAFDTPMGRFSYRQLKRGAFLHGLCHEESHPGYLYATKEKAVLDTLYFDYRGDDPYGFLTESLRIMEEDLEELSLKDLASLLPLYENKAFLNRGEKLMARIGGYYGR